MLAKRRPPPLRKALRTASNQVLRLAAVMCVAAYTETQLNSETKRHKFGETK
jgi:hypothetical protein